MSQPIDERLRLYAPELLAAAERVITSTDTNAALDELQHICARIRMGSDEPDRVEPSERHEDAAARIWGDDYDDGEGSSR